jgi:tripartite-type tricarboxylate transporter receptor subunit TctC
MLSDFIVLMPQIRAGKVFALAATDRSNLLPNVPTLAEVGFPELMKVHASFTVAAPAGTPAPVVQRLNGEINRIMKIPAVASKLEANGLIPVFETPEQFAATLRSEREMWAGVIRRSGIVADQ